MLLVKLFRGVLLVFLICGVTLVLNLFLYQPSPVPSDQWKTDFSRVPSNTSDNILWFVQVSDIHVSRYYDEKRVPDFLKFTTETLETIKPELVLVTGDLTDAKTKCLTGSMQYKDEWEDYQKVLADSNVTQRFVWLDIKGNHDTFDVLSNESTDNFYLKYSGDKGVRSQGVHRVSKPFGNYSFVHVDATLIPGPRRPFNFLGYLDHPKLQTIETSAYTERHSNMTIWYGHYPTSTITCRPSGRLRTCLSHYGATYLCGHLHDLGGIGNNLYAVHRNGFLEAELADWKVNRKYRVVSIDHDMLNFVDTTLDQWPVVLVTLPKPSTFNMPRFEPLHRIRQSSHIRFLIFDPVSIREVKVSIDGVQLDDPAVQVDGGPLWTCRWNPEEYMSDGELHTLRIWTVDDMGREGSTEVQFSDPDQQNFKFRPISVFAIISDFSFWFPMVFIVLVGTTFFSLVIIRQFPIHQIPKTSSGGFFSVTRWLFKLNLLLSHNEFYYPFLIYLINLSFGPQFMAELVTGHYGWCFSYGIWLDGKWLDERQMFVNSIYAMIFNFFPYLLYLATIAEQRWRNEAFRLRDCIWPLSWLSLGHIVIVICLVSNMFTLYYLTVSYGRYALLVNFQSALWMVVCLALALRVWNVEKITLKRVERSENAGTPKS